MINLEKILNKKLIINDTKNYIANINEQKCIGCTKCIKSCPFDAIIGSAKLMHSVLINECTGCGFCVEPCPVDCISMLQVENQYLPQNPFLSNTGNLTQDCENHAKTRFLAKQNRMQNSYQNKKDISNTTTNIQSILLNVANKNKEKYKNARVNILDNELQQQIILKAKQKSLKRKQLKQLKSN